MLVILSSRIFFSFLNSLKYPGLLYDWKQAANFQKHLRVQNIIIIRFLISKKFLKPDRWKLKKKKNKVFWRAVMIYLVKNSCIWGNFFIIIYSYKNRDFRKLYFTRVNCTDAIIYFWRDAKQIWSSCLNEKEGKGVAETVSLKKLGER